ncbi:beta-ketoacyl synthase chain length factor [Leeia aquatica]|uniref:Beta-ketoacyl synthase chain length factor n=1 Tax=Leeia aquatica TaxID=2725557 RepID=A0A847SFV1_9NEIS|nr:beta-ketoacyl synthase chain length factor [Leeia aquatica]NLR76108.1 beta-ketoacyl synthase chain length factor [Leeia aquatica]
MDAKLAGAEIEPMLRRRLSPLARGASWAAAQCWGGLSSVELVYASRHGELKRTVEVVQGLLKGEAASPTQFSLSVLNALPGILSISRQDTSAITAVSAGAETLGWGLLEACIRNERSPSRPILFLFAEEPAPQPFAAQKADPATPCGLAVLLGGGDGARLQLTFDASVCEDSPLPAAQVDACLTALQGKGAATWTGQRGSWTWTLLP